MNETTTTRKQLFFMYLVMAVILATFFLALYKYDQSRITHNTDPTTIKHLQHQLSGVETVNTTFANQVLTLKAENAQLTYQKTQFCAELVKAKVTDPLCTK